MQKFLFLAVLIGTATAFSPLGGSTLRTSLRPVAISARPCRRQGFSSTIRASWQKAVDAASGADYWYNEVTMETSWDPPAEATAKPSAAAAPMKSSAAASAPKKGLAAALNPLKEGVNPLEHPGLVLFIAFKLGIVGWALFVGFHNKYAGDFGPFITFHDGTIDFGTAAAEWARLHAVNPKQ